MGGLGVALDLLVVGLLAATMLHAVRLHRALGALRRDGGALAAAVSGFDDGARQAETGLQQLRLSAERLGTQLDEAGALRDDLAYMMDRGDALANRLDALVRAARSVDITPPVPETDWRTPPAERAAPATRASRPSSPPTGASLAGASDIKVRSQAERNLLVALQGRR